MHSFYSKFLKIFIVTLVSFNEANGQSDTIRSTIIKSLSADLYKYYLSGPVAKSMGDSIKLKFESRGYDTTLNLDEFTYEITKDLRRVSNDYHLNVTPHTRGYYDPAVTAELNAKEIKALKKKEKKSDKAYKKYIRGLSVDMFEYGDIKILPGNIGYVEIKGFTSVSDAKPAQKERISMQSMFEFLKNTHSLILDLRENSGGAAIQMVKFCSYFSDSSNSYLLTSENHFRYDSSGKEVEIVSNKVYNTYSYITNKLTKNKKLYILISNKTFSAAEIVTYKIKRLVPTTTILGQPTTGNVNGVSMPVVSKFYSAIIPYSKIYDESNNNYNIQGKGIKPDVHANADSALAIAYRLVGGNEYDPEMRPLKYLKKTKTESVTKGFEKFYADYSGDYRKIFVIVEQEKLYMIYDTFNKIQLIPTGKDSFKSANFPHIQFIRNDNSSVSEIHLQFEDGYVEKFSRQ
jgi:C-terminal processing protease CtpA/Prc